MHISKNGFTMIEVIFVIVVLGILAAVAIPKFAATRNDAIISKARADIASIRSAIVTERQSRLIQGDSAWITELSSYGSGLFGGKDVNSTLLMYGIPAGDSTNGWVKDSETSYDYNLNGDTAVFTYSTTNGTFTCASNTLCDKLIK